MTMADSCPRWLAVGRADKRLMDCRQHPHLPRSWARHRIIARTNTRKARITRMVDRCGRMDAEASKTIARSSGMHLASLEGFLM